MSIVPPSPVTRKVFSRILKIIALVFTLVGLTACGGGGGKKVVDEGTLDDPESTSFLVKLTVPDELKSSAILLSGVEPRVLVNNVETGEFALTADQQFFSATGIPLNVSTKNAFSVEWREGDSSSGLILGASDAEATAPSGVQELTVVFPTFTHVEFDSDGDGQSNYEERLAGTNPEIEEGVGGSASLVVNAVIPDGPYASEPEVSVRWGPVSTIMSNTSESNYRGTFNQRAAGETGAVEVILKVDSAIYGRIDGGERRLVEGVNTLSYQANEFEMESVSYTVKSALPARDYGSAVRLVMFVDGGNAQELSKSGSEYSKTQSNQSVGSKSVEVRILRESDDLLLGNARKSISVAYGNNTFQFGVGDFGFSHDEDGDGVANVDDADPYTHNNPAELADVVIDGDSYNIKHSISNRLYWDGEAGDEYEGYWTASYEAGWLYLSIYTRDDSLFGDSELDWNDDAIEIFIDSDNSKGTDYDGVNDIAVMIPAFDREGYDNSTDYGLRYSINSRSVYRPFLDSMYVQAYTYSNDFDEDSGFSTNYYLEINIADAGIEEDTLFGFEVFIHDDDNGGDHDAKYTWFSAEDEVYKNPSRAATVMVTR